jgi:hypothetical protein
LDKKRKNTDMKDNLATSELKPLPVPAVLNPTRFGEVVSGLDESSVMTRAVDQLVPVRELLLEYRKKAVSWYALWLAAKAAGLNCTYSTFLRAAKEVERGPVRPLEEARSRANARRRKAVGVAGGSPPYFSPRPVDSGEISSDIFRSQAEQAIDADARRSADSLVKQFGKPTPSTTNSRK